MKGKGENLGHMKNYVFLGLFMAAKAEGLEQQDAATLERIIGQKVRDGEGTGTLDLSKAPQVAYLVGHCQVAKSKKKGFINIQLRGEEGQEVMRIFRSQWNKTGTAQWDPVAGKPIHKDIRDEVMQMNQAKNRR